MSVHSNPPISHVGHDARIATGPAANIKALPTAGKIDPGSLGRQPAVQSFVHLPTGLAAMIGLKGNGAGTRSTDVSRRNRVLEQMRNIAASANPASGGQTPISRGYATAVEQHRFLLNALMSAV